MISLLIPSIFFLLLRSAEPLTLEPVTNFPECTLLAANSVVSCTGANFTDKFPQFIDANTVFSCRECIVPEIPSNAFKDSLRLNSIKFMRSLKLVKISPTAFKGLSKLVDLEIENKDLLTSPGIDLNNLLSSLGFLKIVVLTKIPITSLPNGFLSQSVQRLVLDSTGLQSIDGKAFETASALQQLTIKNPTSSFGLSFLAPLSALTKFELVAGKLTSFTLPSSLTTLQELVLSRSELSGITSGDFGGSAKTLRSLNFDFSPRLDNSKMGELETLTNVEVLSFRDCHFFSAVPASIRKLRKLKHLNLKNTNIMEIAANDLPKFGVLESLDIGIEQLRTIYIDAFSNLNLKTLILGKVNFPQVLLNPNGSTFRDLFAKVAETLQSLRLVACKLQNSFWKELSVLSNIRSVVLSYNEFTSITDFIFGNLTRLNLIELDGNNIAAISQKSTYGIPKTATISLVSNKIQTVDECTFSGRNMTNVKLNGNPLVCDCRLSWLLKHAQQLEDSVTCGPGPNNSKKLKDLKAQDLTCSGGQQTAACVIIPVTTPIPPAPALTFSITQDGNRVIVIVNATLQRWYNYGVTFYSVVGTTNDIKTSSVFSLSGPSEPLEGLVSGKSYNICVHVANSKPSVQPQVLQSIDKNVLCDNFSFIGVNQANIGLVAGLSVVAALLLAVITVLIIWCCLRYKHKSKDPDKYDDKEDIYEEYVYPPSSSVYSPAPPASLRSHPVTRRFVRASDMSRTGTQSTVLTSPTSRFDLSKSTVSLAVQNRHTNHGSTMLSGQAAVPESRKFMSMHDLASGNSSKRPSNYLSNGSRSMDELAPRYMPGRRTTAGPDRERANRALPNPNQEEYTYIEESEEYAKTPSPKTPQPPNNPYLNMDESANTTDSQYMSMSSAHSLDQPLSAGEGYGPVVTPTDTYGPSDASPRVPPRVNGISRRPHHATESQLSLVNNRESADSAHYNNSPTELNVSSTDIGSF